VKTFLKNCKIVNHDKTENGNILIEDGIIKEISDKEYEADTVIDCSGKMVVPGLIDIHVHLRDPGLEYKEDIISGSEVAVAGGITACCCMANTTPVNDNRFITEQMIGKAKAKGLIDLFPVGAVTKKLAGEELTEMGDMLEAGAVAFSDDGVPLMNSEVMRRAVEYATMFGACVMSHCEDKKLSAGGVINEGDVSTITGLTGYPKEAEEVMISRDILISKLTGGRIHLQHVTTKDGIEMIRRAKADGINVTCEVTPHHFSLTDKATLDYDPNYKMNPPLREDEDIQAIKEAFKDGTIDCIATDHAPHHYDDKFQEFDLTPFGILGMQTMLPLSLNLLREGVLSENKFVEMTSYNPAKIINKDDRGEIAVGKIGDITVIDVDKEYVFDDKLNKSKSFNTPFLNQTLKGAASYTIKEGKVVYEWA